MVRRSHLGGSAASVCTSTEANTAEIRRTGVDTLIIAIIGGKEMPEMPKRAPSESLL